MAIVIEAVESTASPTEWLVRYCVDGVANVARVIAHNETSFSIEEHLFFLLSERGLAEVGSSTAYQIHLMHLVQQAIQRKHVQVPCVLGDSTE